MHGIDGVSPRDVGACRLVFFTNISSLQDLPVGLKKPRSGDMLVEGNGPRILVAAES